MNPMSPVPGYTAPPTMMPQQSSSFYPGTMPTGFPGGIGPSIPPTGGGKDSFAPQGGAGTPGGGNMSDADLMQMMQQLGLMGPAGGPAGGPQPGGGAVPGAGRSGNGPRMIEQNGMVLEMGSNLGSGGGLFSMKGFLIAAALGVGAWLIGKRTNLFSKETLDAAKSKLQDEATAFKQYMNQEFGETVQAVKAAIKDKKPDVIHAEQGKATEKLDGFVKAFTAHAPGVPERQALQEALYETHNALFEKALAEGATARSLQTPVKNAKEALQAFYEKVVLA